MNRLIFLANCATYPIVLAHALIAPDLPWTFIFGVVAVAQGVEIRRCIAIDSE